MTSHQHLAAGQSSPVKRQQLHIETRPATLHRSPHSHSGSGAGLWLANSPTTQTSAMPPTVNSEQKPAGKVYHFPAELARGGKPLTDSAAATSTHHQLWPELADEEDVDLDLSFDFVSRFDSSPSSTAGPSKHSDHRPSPSPSKMYRGMQADAAWENRRKKAPPTPLSLAASSTVSRTRSTASSDDARPQSFVGPPASASAAEPSQTVATTTMAPPALPITPLGATRRGQSINNLHQRSFNDLASAEQSVFAQQASSSSSKLRRTPTSIHPTATPSTASITRRPRSSSVRSATAGTPGRRASFLGPPPFPPPTTPLPSPALSPSFRRISQLPLPATGSIRASLDSPRRTRDETAFTRASLDADARRGSTLLQRYEQITGTHHALQSGNALGLVPEPSAAFGPATAVPMQYSATATSTGSSAMTWTQSDQSTPSTMLHSPITPFTPFFSADRFLDTAAPKTPAMSTIESVSSSLQSDATPTKPQQTETRAASTSESDRGDLTTEQWILTQRQRKALMQQHAALVNGDKQDNGDARLSVLATLAAADERATPSRPAPVQTRIVSTSSSGDEDGDRVRETMVISTASTPEEGMSPVRFTGKAVPALLPETQTGKPQTYPMNRWSRSSFSAPGLPTVPEPSSALAAKPMTRARSGTTGPWAQSPLLLSSNVPSAEPSPTTLSAPLPELKNEAGQIRTPNLDALLHSFTKAESKSVPGAHTLELYPETTPLDMGLGLGLDFSGQAPPLYKQRSSGRYDAAPGPAPVSPHLAIDMAPSQPYQQEEAKLYAGAGFGLGINMGRGETGPSPVLPNDCRSPRFATDVPEARIIGMDQLAQDAVMVNRVELDNQPAFANGHAKSMHPSQSIASSISAFAYNPTPAGDPAMARQREEEMKKASAKHASIWRRTSRPRLGLTSAAQEDARGHVHFVNVDLNEEPETSRLTASANTSRNTSNTSAVSNETSTSFGSDRKQWVNKFWNALTPVTPTDVESQQGTPELGEPRQDDGYAATAQRNVSKGSMRPLSLIAKRQSIGAGTLQYARNMRETSPTPGADDEVAERDARQVALRLLSGGAKADGDRQKAEVPAIKAIRTMSITERKAKRSSGIGYITDGRNVASKRQSIYLPSDDTLESSAPADELERTSTSMSRASSLRTKRMSVFGGKERIISGGQIPASDPAEVANADHSTGLNSSAAAFVYAKMQERTAMLDSILSPRVTEADAPEARRAADHIPLLLNASASSTRDEGLTVSELHRAKREMRKLASHNKPALSSDDEQQHRSSRTAEPMLQQPPPCATGMPTSRLAYAHEQQQHWTQPHSRAQSGGTLQHRRTRTARFAPNVETFPDEQYYEPEEEQRGPVSIFTRSRSRNSSFGGRRRQQSMTGYEVQYAAHTNYAHFNGYDQYEHDAHTWTVDHSHVDEYQGRSKTVVEASTSLTYGQYGHDYSARTSARGFAQDAEGSTSKNLFWAGFLGMPWLWLIGGWYVASENGRLKNGARFPLAAGATSGTRKVDMWTHEPSMLHQQRAAQAQFHGGESELQYFDGQNWEFGTTASGSGFGLGSTMDLANGNTYAPSWTTATTGTLATLVTARTGNTTSTDPNRTPARRSGKTKKLKGAKSFGNASLLFDLTPQVSFYQSPMRVFPHHEQPDYTYEDPAPTASSSSSSLHNFGLPQKSTRKASEPTSAQTMLAFKPHSMSAATSSAVAKAMLKLESWAQLERYVLLNRLAAMIAGVLVLTGFSAAIYVVVANF